METETSSEAPQPGLGLSLALSEDGRRLLANYSPVERKAPIDEAWLRRRIDADGYGALFLAESALARLIKDYAAADQAFSLEIGAVRDAEVSITIAPDLMSAFLTVIPPHGGKPVAAEQIRLALTEKQLVTSLQDEQIERIVAAGQADAELIAQGRAAVDGEDGRLECLIEMVRDRHPHLDEHDIANYRDLGGIVTVGQGQRLMEKHPPTPGEAGENVLGQVIPAKPGKEIMYAPQLKGASVSPDNPAILVAAIAGQPVLANNGMNVEPTVTIAQVDLTGGNVDFEGSVEITGDVHAGMEIHATGDIHIGGTVEAAILKAGGNVVVQGGVIGHGEIRGHPDEKKKSMIARISCDGSCSAHFVENASIEAGDSIMVDKLAMQSELAAVNQVLVGKPGSGSGSIIGGVTEATQLVQAGVIGSPSDVNTRVVVGSNPYLQEKLRQANKVLAAKSNEIDEVIKLLAFIHSHPGKIRPEVEHKAENTRAALLVQIEEAQQRRDELTAHLELSADAKVVVDKTLYGNVQVEIAGKVHWVDIQRGKGTFSLKDGEIAFD